MTTLTLEPLLMPGVRLGNEILKATFLPELGGRLISLLHKPLGRELLNRNPVFQPANLAIRNAWFSGGIEWNIGQLGHTFSTCSPLFAAAITGSNGEPALRLYEFERCKKLFWQIDFYLPPSSPWLIAHTRVANPSDHDTSMYWWTNIAVDEGQDVRVLAPTNQAIYTDLSGRGFDFGFADMPHLPTFDGKDASYSLHADSASEFFLQPDSADLPWEAALGKDGSGFIEASTPFLRYRKLFCWGRHQGGQHWQEFLSPGGKPYLEIQAGLAPSQLHGLNMPAHADWHWTQIFGFYQGDAERVHSSDWETAWRSVDSGLKSRIDAPGLSQLDALYSERANLPSTEILHPGSGWGALELERRSGRDEPPVPPSFVFPKETMRNEQKKWLKLLREGELPEQPTLESPGEWMVQAEWRDLLEASLNTAPNWYGWLHLGVMYLENFQPEKAKAAWQASLVSRPSAWAWRNLAVLAGLENNHAKALACLQRAWNINHHARGLAQEYLQALCHEKRFTDAQAVYASLPQDMQGNERIQIILGRIALELGNLETVEQVIDREYAVVREGETELTDIWFELVYRREARALNRPLSETEKAELRKNHPPAMRIDFRSIAK